MSLRAKLFFSFLVILLLMVALIFLNSVNANSENHQIKRLLWINHQYTALLNLKIAVNEQLSEAQKIFIYGKEADLRKFREITEQVKKEVNKLVDAETMEGADDEDGNLQKEFTPWDSDRLLVIQHSYEDLNRELLLLTKLIQVGRSRKAQDHFKSDISEKFREFFSNIDTWTAMEERKLQEVEGSFVSLTRRHNIASIVGLGFILIMVLVFYVLFVYILGPRLRGLLLGTKRIAAGNFAIPVEETGHDEIGNLAKAMNQMMQSLADSRKKLLEQSYYSGMADMVSGVLHNVKNALSPVMIDVEVMEDELRAIDCRKITKAVRMMDTGEISLGKQPDAAEYIELSAAAIASQLKNSTVILEKIANKINLIDQVLSDHDKFAGAERPLESVGLAELIDDSLSLVRKDYLEDIAVGIELGVLKDEVITTQRIVMVQVMANLFNNAVESIIRSGVKNGRIQVTAVEIENGAIHLKILDNGEGIPAGNNREIFQRGVSRKAGSFGLGLHWCANSVASLQGKLYAEGSEDGCGACLHLILQK